MDPELITWAFFFGGLALMVAEKFIPGGIWLALGLSGLSVAGLRGLGLLGDPVIALVTWLVFASALAVAVRPFAVRYFGGDYSMKLTSDEDAEAMGQTVPVLEPIAEDAPGRIRFRGASWDARTLEGTIPAGREAKILYRDNLTWIVEPASPADEADALDAELRRALEEANTADKDAARPEDAPTPPRRNRGAS
jgi:membrane protein implicated in regulation of membrane protease activity